MGHGSQEDQPPCTFHATNDPAISVESSLPSQSNSLAHSNASLGLNQQQRHDRAISDGGVRINIPAVESTIAILPHRAASEPEATIVASRRRSVDFVGVIKPPGRASFPEARKAARVLGLAPLDTTAASRTLKGPSPLNSPRYAREKSALSFGRRNSLSEYGHWFCPSGDGRSLSSREASALLKLPWHQIFPADLEREYYRFYLPLCRKYWRIVDACAIIFVILYMVYVALGLSYPGTWRPGVLSMCGAMLLFALLEVGLSFTKMFDKYPAQIHLALAALFGGAFALTSFMNTDTSPNVALFLYLLVLYSSVCQPYLGAIAICAPVSTAVFLSAFFHVGVAKTAVIPDREQCDYPGFYSCVEKVTAVGLLYLAANCFGAYYAFFLDRYTRKTFLKTRLLLLKQDSIMEEQQKLNQLALSVLPARAWEDLRLDKHQSFDYVTALHRNLMYQHEEVSILFADIVGFTELSTKRSASDLVALLNNVFSVFDQLVAQYALEKIKTIGDCYVVCAGVPEPIDHHALRTVAVALEMIRNVSELFEMDKLSIRVGVHSGQVWAGLIGSDKLVFGNSPVWSARSLLIAAHRCLVGGREDCKLFGAVGIAHARSHIRSHPTVVGRLLHCQSTPSVHRCHDAGVGWQASSIWHLLRRPTH